VKIIDFGVAHMVDSRSQSSGFRKGTLLYMAPEQIQFKPVSPQSDIFSLGVVCYEALTRRQPFRSTREEDVIQAILKLIPPRASEINPSVSDVMSRVVHKAMAKQQWNRYDSAREFGETLQKALRNQPIELFDPTRLEPRIQRATKALESGDYQFAAEIVGELEAEGNVDPQTTLLRTKIDRVVRQKTITQLLEAARARYEKEEHPLALQKIQEILQIDPTNAAALGLKSKIEDRRNASQIQKWLGLAQQHIVNHSYSHARQTLQNVLQLRPNESRATRLLTEIESEEQEYLRLRQEKGQIYQAAQNSWKNGEVSEAVSQMGLVLELDRRAPDTSSAEGSQTYQSFYNTVRFEHDAMNNAYAEARQAIAQEDFEKALAACNVYLTKYPGNALFQALRIDIEEQSRQRLSAYIAEIDCQLEGEPDLDNKLDLLRGALDRCPGEAHFERSLKLITDKRDLVNSIVLRARQHDERGQLNQALGDLKIVHTIYSAYPGLAFEIERLQKKRERQGREAAKADWIKRIDRSLALGEYSVALEFLANAQQEFAGDSELTELEKLVHAKRDRADQAQQLVLAGQDLCQQGKFEKGLDGLRQALSLDEPKTIATNALVEALVDAAQIAIARNWRRAESLVEEAIDLDPYHSLAKYLQSQISDRKTDEEVGQFVSRARKLRGDGDFDGALVELNKGLDKYPSEARLSALRETLEQEVAQIGRRRARLRDLEEAKTISVEASEASTEELESIDERTRAFAVQYPEDAEFRSVAAEVDRIVKERAARTPPKQERPRPGTPWVLVAIPKRVLWAAGAALVSVAAEINRIVRGTARIPPKQERSRPGKPRVLTIPNQVLWVAGTVLVLVAVLLTVHPWRSRSPALVTSDPGPRAEFEAVMSSSDPAVLGDFLSRNPSGEYHDRVAERLDDLMWANAKGNDVASLNAYLSRFPGGRHADQARTQVAALAPASVPDAEQPKVEGTTPAAADDKSAVLKVIRQYQQAYQNESVNQLKVLWPQMGERRIRALNALFSHAQLVELDCKVTGEPIIAGNDSTLKLTQTLTYLANAKNHTVSSTRQLIMHLRKQSSDPGSTHWRIESIE
jgi:serine/threonine-protein kinase